MRQTIATRKELPEEWKHACRCGDDAVIYLEGLGSRCMQHAVEDQIQAAERLSKQEAALAEGRKLSW